jgi:ATP-dependent helicase/nuclease subunit A
MTARHVMIMASAGAGKTYALTSRYVALLAAGAPPERIVALTFTRKAAGEFFDEILHKLAQAASDPAYAQRLAAELGRPELGPAEFLRLLRAVVDAMPRLRLGTLDGFFARIARAFPFELGLTGEFEVLHEHAARLERQRVLQRMFARLPDGLDAAQKDFIEAFKRSTFGVEEKRLGPRLDAFLDAHQEPFLATREENLWGNAARIWPDGCEWLEPPAKTVADALDSLRTRLARRGLPEGQWRRWEVFFASLAEWSPPAPLPEAAGYLLKNTLEVWADVRRGAAEVRVDRKKMPLDPAECEDLAIVVRHVFAAAIRARLEATRGIFAVLRGYEAIYHDTVRRSGKLTFGDVQRLLQPDVRGDADRLQVDWRLDARFDHWLLDEFQDTSFGQWSVLRNLIDEAVQDPTGTRSFFCVGDVKQAIFTWREGDPQLFQDILDHYNSAAPGTIAEEHLVTSYRSGPAVVEMVNAVFGGVDRFGGIFPVVAAARWRRVWRAHVSSRPQLDGQSAWLFGADDEERRARTLAVLQEIAPLERGLECAVLTQSNREAAALADYLRRFGNIPALAESDLNVCTDNPLGAALLALVKAAAHPGDTAAWEHVRMTPLRAVLEHEGVASPEAVTLRVLTQIHGEGFERALEYWLRRLEPTLAGDDLFSRERARQLVAAAAAFDATGSRDVAEFVAFMERHTVRDAETAGVVRVMTIHKAKGLGFDVVVLPDIEGNSIDKRRDTIAVQRSPQREVQWVLDLPSEPYVSHDPTLAAHVAAGGAESCYEAFCLLYVAMTRAKRAMYVIAKPPGKSTSRNYPRILSLTLGEELQRVRVGAQEFGGAWSNGNPDWHRALPPRPKSEPVAAAPISWLVRENGVRPQILGRRLARRPSAGAHGTVAAATLLAGDAGAATALGNAVHARLAEIAWLPDGREADRARSWREPAAGVAGREALACVQAADLEDVWRMPGAGSEVWRERAFEIVLDGAWVTGIFDRVVVERRGGGVRRVTVYDFKTDRVGEGELDAAALRHAGQLGVYRRVAAVLAGVGEERVDCELVFTRLCRRVTVPRA